MLSGTPFLKFFIAFAVGIAWAYCLPTQDLSSAYILLIFLAIAYISILIFTKPSINAVTRPMMLGTTAFGFLFLSGYINFSRTLPHHQPKHIMYVSDVSVVKGIIIAKPNIHGSSALATLECNAAKNKDGWHSVSGKVLVRMQDFKLGQWSAGDEVLFSTTITPITSKLTLGAFDSKGFYALQNIHVQTNIQSHDLIKIGEDNRFLLTKWSAQCAEFCEKIIDKNIKEKNEANISKALLLGIRSEVDRDLKKAYSNAGVIHVLAVSGLHVTLLFAIFQFFFRRMMVNSRIGEIFSICILIILLWAFAFITGLSASVVRAVVMFTLFMVAQLLGRRSDILNTIFVSAFAMLLYQASYLFDVGFQLSYLAVIGIVIIHPWWFEKLEIRNPILNKITEATSITLAAQLSTAPLCMYYFHQFPNYFLPANLLIIFATNAVMILLIALLACSWLQPLADLSSWAAEMLLSFSNQYVGFIDKLPYSTINSIFLTGLQLLSLYMIMLVLALMIKYKKFAYSYLCLLSAMLFFASATYRNWEISQRNEIVIIGSNPVLVGYAKGNSFYFPYPESELSPIAKSQLALYGTEYFNYSDVKSVPTIQHINGFSLATPHKNISIKNFKSLPLPLKPDACYTSTLAGNRSNIYWLNYQNIQPNTGIHQTHGVPYLSLGSNEIIVLPLKKIEL